MVKKLLQITLLLMIITTLNIYAALLIQSPIITPCDIVYISNIVI